MTILMTIMQTINGILGALPEAFGLLIFAFGLIAAAVFMRRIFGRRDAKNLREMEKTIG